MPMPTPPAKPLTFYTWLRKHIAVDDPLDAIACDVEADYRQHGRAWGGEDYEHILTHILTAHPDFGLIALEELAAARMLYMRAAAAAAGAAVTPSPWRRRWRVSRPDCHADPEAVFYRDLRPSPTPVRFAVLYDALVARCAAEQRVAPGRNLVSLRMKDKGFPVRAGTHNVRIVYARLRGEADEDASTQQSTGR